MVDDCGTETCRPEVLTLSYLKKAKFTGVNTIKHYRRDPLIVWWIGCFLIRNIIHIFIGLSCPFFVC